MGKFNKSVPPSLGNRNTQTGLLDWQQLMKAFDSLSVEDAIKTIIEKVKFLMF